MSVCGYLWRWVSSDPAMKIPHPAALQAVYECCTMNPEFLSPSSLNSEKNSAYEPTTPHSLSDSDWSSCDFAHPCRFCMFEVCIVSGCSVCCFVLVLCPPFVFSQKYWSLSVLLEHCFLAHGGASSELSLKTWWKKEKIFLRGTVKFPTYFCCYLSCQGAVDVCICLDILPDWIVPDINILPLVCKLLQWMGQEAMANAGACVSWHLAFLTVYLIPVFHLQCWSSCWSILKDRPLKFYTESHHVSPCKVT